MPEDERMQKMLKSIQASIHDQINAVKSEAQKAVGDSDAALELSATLEKNIHELESGKFETNELLKSEVKVLELMEKNIEEVRFESRKAQALTFMNQQCLHLSIVGTIKTLIAGEALDIDKQLKYIDQLANLIIFNHKFNEKIRNATEAKQIESFLPQLANEYSEIQNAISS